MVEHDEESVIDWELITNASWLTLNLANMSLEGTPLQHHAGNVSVQLTAVDQLGQETTFETAIEVIPVNDAPFWVGLPTLVTVSDTNWIMDLSQYVGDLDDPVDSLLYMIAEGVPRLNIQGNSLVGRFDDRSKDIDIEVIVVDPHGARSSASFTVKVDIPTEPDPVPTVAYLFPWLLVALVCALCAGILLSHNERRKRDREDE
jgi:hypothetical protein